MVNKYANLIYVLCRYLKAFIYDSPFLDYGASKSPGCFFRVVGKPIRTKSYAFGFPKNSAWKESITKLILKYQRKNYFDTLTKKWFMGSGCLDSASGKSSVSHAHRMASFNFSGLFTICACAMIFCGLLLALEAIYFKVRYAKKSGEVTVGNSTTMACPSVSNCKIESGCNNELP